MAFITPTPVHHKKARLRNSATTSPYATATAPRRRQSTTKPHKKAPAHVIDSRISARTEAHHWVTVRAHAARTFERAAVAQADAARALEGNTGGNLHRWLLRDSAQHAQDASYVVMECFARGHVPHTRRWLAAVEKLGPAVNAVDIRTMKYDNLFTCKLHDLRFDPVRNVVVIEAINVDMSKDGSIDAVVDALQNAAQQGVASGHCLEFCVLKGNGQSGFLKTVEVYEDEQALEKHMLLADHTLSEALKPYTISPQRSRRTFQPVVFA